MGKDMGRLELRSHTVAEPTVLAPSNHEGVSGVWSSRTGLGTMHNLHNYFYAHLPTCLDEATSLGTFLSCREVCKVNRSGVERSGAQLN